MQKWNCIKKTTKGKNDKVTEKLIDGLEGIESKLLKPALLVNRYFKEEKATIEHLEVERDGLSTQLEEMEEEHGSEDGLLWQTLKMIRIKLLLPASKTG